MASTAAIQPAWTLQSLDTAQVGRFHDGALVSAGSSVPTTAFRSGVIGTASTTGLLTPNDFGVIQSGTPGMSVQVEPGYAALTRSGDAPYLVCNTANKTLTVATSDPTNARIDLVYLQVLDSVAGDASTATQVGIVTGTPSGTPVAPSLPGTGVCIPLVHVAVAANATSIVNANITDFRLSTAFGAPPRLLMGGDSASSAGNRVGEQRQRILTAFGNVVSTETWGYDGVWHGSQSLEITQPTLSTPGIPSGTSATIASFAIPDPGWPYHIVAGAAQYAQQTNGGAVGSVLHNVYVQVDTATPDTNVISSGNGANYSTSTSIGQFAIAPEKNSRLLSSTGYTGSHTVYMVCSAVGGNISTISTDANGFHIKIVPV